MTSIANGELGLSVRTKLNDLLTASDALTLAVTDAQTAASDAELAAASASATATALTGFDLAAIAASKAITAVDGFVYDTSKDSDGGAWRKRTQHTSWYNETLNTATRGSRREFPAVAVIVAEATKVTIYDGDDPALPMWRVDARGSTVGWSGDWDGKCVTAKNGAIVRGTTHPSYLGYGAVTLLSLVGDYAIRYSQNLDVKSAIFNSTFSTGAGTNISAAIVNSFVNDVAMTVLPNAPIDPATGLPVPTIAVATNGGVSVIKDDGTVVDITGTLSSGTDDYHISFDAENRLHFTHRGNSTYPVAFKEIPSIDVLISAADVTYGVTGSGFVPNTGIYLPAGIGQIEAYLPTASAGQYGLFPLQTDFSAPTKSMQATVTSTYNTGWMNGDIKGAFLSSTDATSLVGSELITGQNRTFSVDAADRTAFLAAYSDYSIPDTNYLVSVSGGVLSISRNSGGTSGPTINCTTVSGKRYAIVAKIEAMSHDITLLANPQASVGDSAAVVGSYYYATFTAASTSTSITVFPAASVSATLSISDLRLVAIDDDRSVNNKGLIVNGTVTRSAVATGAELVAYSGFSFSNYLEQPYNSALDFGTGDFCVMGWVKQDGTIAFKSIVNKVDAATPTLGWQFLLSGDNTPYFYNYTTASGTTSTGKPIPTNSWSFVGVKRSGTTVEVFVNGNAIYTAIIGTTLSGNYPLNIGSRQGSVPFTGGSLALLRISATAPTAEQIKKIYEDEKVLFQENAAATLYGTSDAVTALAHDSDTGLLHVGTSAGRSVFQGLRRVSNTTTAVGTAISASNGLVVEE